MKPTLVKKSEAQERYTRTPQGRDTRLYKSYSPSYAIGIDPEKRKEVFNGLFNDSLPVVLPKKKC